MSQTPPPTIPTETVQQSVERLRRECKEMEERLKNEQNKKVVEEKKTPEPEVITINDGEVECIFIPKTNQKIKQYTRHPVGTIVRHHRPEFTFVIAKTEEETLLNKKNAMNACLEAPKTPKQRPSQNIDEKELRNILDQIGQQMEEFDKKMVNLNRAVEQVKKDTQYLVNHVLKRPQSSPPEQPPRFQPPPPSA